LIPAIQANTYYYPTADKTLKIRLKKYWF